MYSTNGNGTCAGRSSNGRFALGNKGGPGRPPRATERHYLAVLADVVPLETWRAICLRAVADAKKGDAKARDWIAKYLLGAPGDLWSLAAMAQLEECQRAKEEARA
jgi:hypothetical protein